ncbi:sugar ABC transporter substrate-binding protein [Streptomyces iranensis]|uniref:Ribose transport system substrate-binding protein n=1 Tax=Streptomyces iranensis TaxID=576784 RepID=A0A061A349_9ACTN|nr:sugar ABC transporter substrate-binding protein [Streptomyces iranensis]MBP2060251.1 ribose transport system substrate-binding protein [Streptomyces iranensis]CDR15791.1 sugar ABC transporter substrate-binding protein [Streptomyces iranensis]
MPHRLTTAAAALLLLCGPAVAGCGGGADAGRVGVVLPLLTSPFWEAYNDELPEQARKAGVRVLPTVNSDNDPGKQITDIDNLLAQDVGGLVVSPIDSAAIGPGLSAARRAHVPVVAVDVAPDRGRVAIVVRADNRAYGVKACHSLGRAVRRGTVVQIEGDLASVNGRDRTAAFDRCMARQHPDIKILDIPADWQAEKAAAGLEALYSAHPGIKGIYLQAGGVYLAPTLRTLQRHRALVPVGRPGHIAIVSNDGIPQELDAIRKGLIDATVSQPADLYAVYAMRYIRQAMAGKPFRAGPTGHGSTIVRLPGGNLEDQLPAPLVTRANVDDRSLWGNRA